MFPGIKTDVAMSLIDDIEKILNTEYVGMFIICRRNKFNTPKGSGLLVIAIELKAKSTFHAAAILRP
jgi:hypothetical protein